MAKIVIITELSLNLHQELALFIKNETKETKNQVFCYFLSLLVCRFSLTGRWSTEIPDID